MEWMRGLSVRRRSVVVKALRAPSAGEKAARRLSARAERAAIIVLCVMISQLFWVSLATPYCCQPNVSRHRSIGMRTDGVEMEEREVPTVST